VSTRWLSFAVGPIIYFLGPRLASTQVAPVSTSRLRGTYTLTAVCAKSCDRGFLYPRERVQLVLNDTTVYVVPASREGLAQLRMLYYLAAQILGPANACFTVSSPDDSLRLVRLAHWSRYPDDSLAIVTLEVGVDNGYVINLSASDRSVVATLPTRDVPAPDSLLQFTGVRSGPPDPELCTRATDHLVADSVPWLTRPSRASRP
jgi:hypothetical protein